MAEHKVHMDQVIKEEKDAPVTPAEVTDGGTPVTAVEKKKKIREKGPFFKISGIMLNARTMSIALEEIEPLGKVIPKDETARKNWKFDLKVRPAAFEGEWGLEEDTKLLLGVWEYGMGSWEAIRESDPVLKEKILIEGDKKPQYKDIAHRAELLLKVLKKHLATIEVPKKARKKGKKAAENGTLAGITVDGLNAGSDKKEEAGEKGKNKSTVKKRQRQKKDKGPLHFSASTEPTPVNYLGDWDPVVFNECKEKMRPVKKALKALDNPDSSLSEKEQIKHTRTCLLQIGDQIQKCLNEFTDPYLNKQWKRYDAYFLCAFLLYNCVYVFMIRFSCFSAISGTLSPNSLNMMRRSCTNCTRKRVKRKVMKGSMGKNIAVKARTKMGLLRKRKRRIKIIENKKLTNCLLPYILVFLP